MCTSTKLLFYMYGWSKTDCSPPTLCNRTDCMETLRREFCISYTVDCKSIATNSFNRIIKIWNSLPPIDLSNSFYEIKKSILSLYWDYFTLLLILFYLYNVLGLFVVYVLHVTLCSVTCRT